MSRVLFLGLGHLGQYFLEQNKEHEVIGTKRDLGDNETSSLIKFSLGEDWTQSNDFDVIIISFPPVEDYLNKLKKLLIELSPQGKVIFISSTSVYGIGHINEESKKLGQRRNAKVLMDCEEEIKKLDDYIIIRPGGLIDEGRHPSRIAKKMTNVSKSQTNVNLVHTGDVASFIHHVIHRDLSNEDYNLVCDDHPMKEDFYRRFNDEISFDSDSSDLRIIDNSKSMKTGFQYKYSDLNWTL